MIRFADLGRLFMRESVALERLRSVGFIGKTEPLPAAIRVLRCLDDDGGMIFAVRRAEYLEFLRAKIEATTAPKKPAPKPAQPKPAPKRAPAVVGASAQTQPPANAEPLVFFAGGSVRIW